MTEEMPMSAPRPQFVSMLDALDECELAQAIGAAFASELPPDIESAGMLLVARARQCITKSVVAIRTRKLEVASVYTAAAQIWETVAESMAQAIVRMVKAVGAGCGCLCLYLHPSDCRAYVDEGGCPCGCHDALMEA